MTCNSPNTNPGLAMVIPKKHAANMSMHITPRFVGDPFKVMANWDDKPTRDELDAIAGQIGMAYKKRWRGLTE